MDLRNMSKFPQLTLFACLIMGVTSITQAASNYTIITNGSCAQDDVIAENTSSAMCLDYSGNQDGADYQSSINTDFGLSNTIEWDGTIHSDDGTLSTTDTTWTYSGTLSAPFVIILKATNAFTAYLFDAPDVANDGTYEVSITNKKGIAHNLSHMTIYTTTSELPLGIDIYGDLIPAVPLPAALWLFGPALLGFIGFRRKLKS